MRQAEEALYLLVTVNLTLVILFFNGVQYEVNNRMYYFNSLDNIAQSSNTKKQNIVVLLLANI